MVESQEKITNNMNTEKIDEIMDCSEFAEVLSDFSSLAIEKLAEETEEMSQKIREFRNSILLL